MIKKSGYSGIIFLFIIIFSVQHIANGQGLNLAEIKNTLLENSPNNGDMILRKRAILDLDNILKNDSCRTSVYFKSFYADMMQKVSTEIKSFKDTPTIWTMYNHGYIVRTKHVTFAFDLVQGYWGYSLFPDDIASQIDVLFISHSHGDHYSSGIVSQIKERGGKIVVPSAIAYLGNVSMEFGDTLNLTGLQIKIYQGLHSVSNAIYEVTTAEGIKFLHTGDNQTSDMLPYADSVDVLLLNAWVNESGYTTAVTGMENSMKKIRPALMIPGHLQELGHAYDPSNMASRAPYEWVYDVYDLPPGSEVLVMAWGEKFELPASMTTDLTQTAFKEIPRKISISQNYPNPFNPITTIRLTLGQAEDAELKVFDLRGKEICTLLSGNLQPGNYYYNFDGSNLASGVYMYRLVTESGFSTTKKFILLK